MAKVLQRPKLQTEHTHTHTTYIHNHNQSAEGHERDDGRRGLRNTFERNDFVIRDDRPGYDGLEQL